ncbi:MAG: hypothetical protein Q8O88_04170 [bacterium]|nr:hypothetical protein [bacterium]
MTITKRKIKVGKNYYVLIFSGHSSRIYYGNLSYISNKTKYAFHSDKVYRVFSLSDLESSYTGQPVRAEIRNGTLSFMSFFINEDEAKYSSETLPKSITISIIEKSLSADSIFIKELRSSMMNRLSMMNDIVKSKNLQEMAVLIKRSTTEKNSSFLL